MSKLALVIVELHRSERHLAQDLRAIAARHHGDQDITHLAQDLAGWCDEHVIVLAQHGRRYRLRLSAKPRRHYLRARLQERVSDALRHRPETALLLLADLRRVHRVAAGVSLDWELLAQGAQAAKDHDLLAITKQCHPQSLRQMRWANAMLKELSPQALTA
jgi:Tfp pilus assembly protein PilN